MIAALLKWTGLPQWAMELIALGGLWLAFLAWHHSVIDKGIAEQVAADNKASAKLITETTAENTALKLKADTAEHAHDQELADLATYRGSHPEQPVRLCIDSHNSGAIVSHSAGINVSNASLGSAGISVQQVPDGNSSGGSPGAGPDIEPMLGALGAAADKVSAELREFQSRKTP